MTVEEFKSRIDDIMRTAHAAAEEAKNATELDAIFRKYVGKKGLLKDFFSDLRSIADNKRAASAAYLNKEIASLEQQLRVSAERFGVRESGRGSRRGVDISIPGTKAHAGHLHPLTHIERRIEHLFSSMGFSVIEGPEAEDAWHNFDALNIPPDHPARDLWDTFWLRSSGNIRGIDKRLLRTHTSPMQVRYMETHEPPFRIIVPGKVYRFEATDASHEFQFNQVEGLMVGSDITVANFKHTITAFFEHFFGQKIHIRLRSSFFPFTEPSFEVDIRCIFCSGKGCATCSRSGWLEVMGAGMVHPNVFKAVGYNPKFIQGFAFGFGLERMAMIKYRIPDIRLFNSGDMRLSEQF